MANKPNISAKNNFGGLHIENPEFKGLLFSQSFEKKDLLRPTPDDFLRTYAPSRLGVLRSAMSSIGFKFRGEFITDLTMPMNILGYYEPWSNVLSINPMLLLYSSEKEIAHVLFHEGLHGGVYGPSVMDEVVVETMTKKKMSETYGGPQMASGYDGMVNETEKYFGDLSFDQMSDKIENGDKKTLDNFLELIVLEPMMKDAKATAFEWNSIESKIHKNWGMVQRLFPRMVNNIAGNGKGLHESGQMNFCAYDFSNLLQKTAERLISEKPEVIVDIFMEISSNGNEVSNYQELLSKMISFGLGYLLEFKNSLFTRLAKEFVLQVNIAKSLGNEVNKSKIALMTN